jgi:hypothetical protein
LFFPVGTAHIEQQGNGVRICNGAQCQACRELGLVVAFRDSRAPGYALEAFYPLGAPDDSVADEVPKLIAGDFGEALRCLWVKAYKATVTMCRRALQSSCVELKAKDGKLHEQIDDLATRGVITASLKEMAHEVRLTGNDGSASGQGWPQRRY